jgi:hypothetical protein
MAKGRAVAIELNDVVKRELTTLTRKHGEPDRHLKIDESRFFYL